MMSGNHQPLVVLTQTHVLDSGFEGESVEEFEEVGVVIEFVDVAFVGGVCAGNEEILVIVGDEVPHVFT